MTTATGKVTSYDLTNGVIVNMDEAIYLYPPMDLPLLTGVGADGNSVLSQGGVDEVSFSWLDEDGLEARSALQGAVTTGDAYIIVTAGDQARFSTGEVLMVVKSGGTEVMRVTGYGSTADSLTVTRALVGTATNYADLSVVIGLGVALAEGSDPENFRAKDTNTRTNNTQIFGPIAIQMSGTNLVVPRYGIPDQWAHQLFLRTLEQGKSREQAFLYGRKYNSTTTKIRTTGGLKEFITTYNDATNTQLTVSKIQGNLASNYNAGGLPDVLMANPASLTDLNDLTNTSVIVQTIDDPVRGRRRVSVVVTEYGDLSIVRNRHLDKMHAFCYKRDGVKRRVMRPFQFEPLAKTGDSKKGQILSEEGLQVKGERHMHCYSTLTSY